MSQTWSNEYLVNWNGQKSASSEFGEWKKLDQPSHTLRDFPWQTCKGCLVTADWRQHAHSNATWIPKPWAAVDMIHMIHGNHPRLSQNRPKNQVSNEIWLVVSIPLKNMLVTWDYYSQYMEKKKMFQSTNQKKSWQQETLFLMTFDSDRSGRTMWWHLSQAMPFWPYQPYTTVPYPDWHLRRSHLQTHSEQRTEVWTLESLARIFAILCTVEGWVNRLRKSRHDRVTAGSQQGHSNPSKHTGIAFIWRIQSTSIT